MTVSLAAGVCYDQPQWTFTLFECCLVTISSHAFMSCIVFTFCYSTLVGEQSIAISLSVCVCAHLCVCQSVREHISATTSPIFAKFCVPIPCGRGSVLLWRHCDTLCTSGFMDDVTFGRSGLDGDTWRLHIAATTGAGSDVYECLATACDKRIVF